MFVMIGNRIKISMIFSCVLFLNGCGNGHNIFENIVNTTLVIPQNTYVINEYDGLEHDLLKVIYYINENECNTCQLSYLFTTVKSNRQFLEENEIGLNCVIESKDVMNIENYVKYNVDFWNGHIYIDTCKVFLNKNPQIPDNELYHTFVINNEGKVLMVGNPFANEKMEALFKKVIANERKKQKAKKSA